MESKPIFKECRNCKRKYASERDLLENATRFRLCSMGNLWFNCRCRSTLVILKGQFDWYSPDLLMSEEARSLFNTIPNIKQLPHIPSAVMELQQVIQDPEVTSKRLADAARKAPIVAGNVLKTANEWVLVRGGAPIKSLEHAISFVGLKTMQDLIIVAQIQGFPFQCKIFDGNAFWQHAFLTGRIAERLAGKFESELVPDEAYIAGSLCNIGKLVLAISHPETADLMAADETNGTQLSSWVDAERRHGVHSHQVLGEIGACFWGLPESVIYAVRYHHWTRYPANMPHTDITRIAAFANQLAHWVALNPTRIEQKLLDSIAKHYGITTEAQMEPLVAELMPLRDIKG